MTARRRIQAGLAVAAIGCLLAPAASAGQSPTPATQLQGTFAMTGTVTVAQFVRGEHVGETVQRSWTFTPLCASGPCAQVRLVRSRSTGTDTLTLTATGPHAYAGTGQYFAPLRCAGQIHRPGQAIPVRIKVHVTASGPAAGGGTTATAITATYVNVSRVNLTRCVAVLGHDAAHYHGTLATG